MYQWVLKGRFGKIATGDGTSLVIKSKLDIKSTKHVLNVDL